MLGKKGIALPASKTLSRLRIKYIKVVHPSPSAPFDNFALFP